MNYLSKRVYNKFSYYKIKFLDKLFPVDYSDHFNSREYCIDEFHSVKETVKRHAQIILSNRKISNIMEFMKTSDAINMKECIDEANKICKNTIKVLGKEYHLGAEINWHRDYESGVEWPLKFYKDLTIINLSDHSDIKFVWEISRFHYIVILGMAYCYTSDDKYVKAFLRYFYSWIESNPPNRGVNWNCSMEVSIRLINIIWGYIFFMDSDELSDSFHILLMNFVLIHARHIYNNLENRGIANGNHYIANLLGLLYVGIIFPVFKCSNKIKKFAVKEIIEEMKSQVYSDGVSYEDSISYHRLVTEMFFHATYLIIATSKISKDSESVLDNRGLSNKIIGPEYTNKLEKMFEFIKSYLKPDGLAPQVGDNDSGRILFLGKMNLDWNDHRSLLALGGEFFDRDDFRVLGNEYQANCLWYLGSFKEVKKEYKEKHHSKAFKKSGFYILRKKKDYMIIRCGENGMGGKGSHTHNDNMSFELCADGITYIVDPGTFTYSRYPELRNQFRSTRYHNTLIVDGYEQNEFIEQELFSLKCKSDSRVLNWQTEYDEDLFVGEINYSLDDEEGIRHRRVVSFNKRNMKWDMKDIVYGKGEHALTWYFHMNKGIKIIIKDGTILMIYNHLSALCMLIENYERYDTTVSKGFYSPGYGFKEESYILTLSMRTLLPIEVNYSFSVSHNNL